ncbi:MAG: hypothetical protein KGJ86_11870 [Chloroflexota bacterium]|nr:hypothetical protein [Chloroflexota bacterium]
MRHSWAFALLDILQLRRSGCTSEQIDRLVELRRRVRRSELGEFTLDTRRIRFARWLIQLGRLSDTLPAGSTANRTPP